MDIKDIQTQIVEATPCNSATFNSAVVFSGGEPTLQSDALIALARFAKSKSLAIGLETNGCGTDVVREMLDEKILDKVFLDIKAPLDDHIKLSSVIGLDKEKGLKAARNIAKTLSLCLAANIEIEVRTTVLRGLVGINEVKEISRYMGKFAAKNITYVIQQGIPEKSLGLKNVEIYKRDELLSMAKASNRPKNLNDIQIRTNEYGDEKIVELIAFVGMPASGKGVVADVVKEMGYPVVNMGDFIREEVKRLGLELTDENLGNTGTRLRQKDGPSAIARLTILKLRRTNTNFAVIDGVRNIEEVDLFKKEFGDDFLLINIESSREDRLARIRKRGRADDRLMDEERLRIRDERELGWGMGESIKNADLTIVNDGTLYQLRKKVKKIIEEQR